MTDRDTIDSTRDIGHLFTKRTDVLPQNPMKSRIREIVSHNGRVTLKFDRHFASAAKFQSDWKSLNPNVTALKLTEVLR